MNLITSFSFLQPSWIRNILVLLVNFTGAQVPRLLSRPVRVPWWGEQEGAGADLQLSAQREASWHSDGDKIGEEHREDSVTL